MTDKPAETEFCAVCQQPMKWFGDHWVCTAIKVHDNAKISADSSRGGGSERGATSA